MINATVLELYKVTASLLERYNLEARWGWKWRWSGSSLRRKRVRHCQQMPPHHVTSVMHLCLSIYSLSDQLCLRSHPWEGGMNLLTLSLNLWDLMKVQSYTTCDDPAWRKVLTCCCQYSLNPHPIVAVCSRWVLLLFPLSQTESCILTFYKVLFFIEFFYFFYLTKCIDPWSSIGLHPIPFYSASDSDSSSIVCCCGSSPSSHVSIIIIIMVIDVGLIS